MKTKIHLGLSYTIPGFIPVPVNCWQLLDSDGYSIAGIVVENNTVTDARGIDWDSIHSLVSRVFDSHGYITTQFAIQQAHKLFNSHTQQAV